MLKTETNTPEMMRRVLTAAKRAGIPPERPAETLKAYTVNVLVIPPNYAIAPGIATVHEEKRTIYGTSRKDALEREGIQ
jgi:hypothetical protein